jgi:hypothetical protein
LELLISGVVNYKIDKLNVNLSITVLESHELLPNLENIGVGDIKFQINGFSISKLVNNYKSDTILFLRRRANIFF